MVQAFEKQEIFLTTIKEDVARASAFYASEAAPVIKAMEVAREEVQALLKKGKTGSKADMHAAINVDTETLEGVEVMDALGDAYMAANAVLQFWYVNREAVRKIVKKYLKKTEGKLLQEPLELLALILSC